MTHALVVGGGVAGLLTVQALLDRADDLAERRTDHSAGRRARADEPLAVTWLVHRPGYGTASRSGGLSLRYASADPRGDAWTSRSAVLAAGLAARHPHLRPHVGSTRALLLSRRAPVRGYPGQVVDPAGRGLPHEHGLLHETSPQWDPCGLLPRWPLVLAEDPRVRLLEMPEPVTSTADLAVLHDLHGATTTVACLGLGAHVLGDTRLAGRLGVLLRGPLPVGSVHAEGAVIDDDDELRPRYTVPHGSSGPDGSGREGHLHVGGTYLPVEDPADWDDPSRLAGRALAEVPALLADVAERFPDLAGWQPDGPPWWGIRPVRDSVALGRVDPSLVGGRDVVVTHGWGGSGWTIGPAVAEEIAVSLLPGPGTGPGVDSPPGPASDPLAAHGPWHP
ncbi:FAD-dependent oxidoreductase [Aquipuribacter sp. MA13-6]|uniref:FAD-dependent oxidoreductase n=1 Tax=unclassified Aquipuribacter TaxID=2635084 RepID=UPI003EEEB8CD